MNSPKPKAPANTPGWMKINQNHHQCTKCEMRHPSLVKKCFFCGGVDTIKLNPIKEEDKLKSNKSGATLSLTFNK